MRALLLAIAVTGIAAGTAVPPAALAQAEAGRSMSVPISPTAPERYVVKKGDTLWDISGMYLNDPWYWPEIWYVNPSIANPHLIFPGDVLYFSYVDGKPRVSLEPASAMRLSPEVRSSDLDGAIRAIPYDLLMDFVSRPSLLDRDQVRNAPYIVGMRNRHIVGSTSNEVYSRGLDNPAAGMRFNIINVGEEMRDPDDGDLLGYIGHFAGLGEVIQSSGAVVPGKDSIFDMRREEPLTHMHVLETGREIMQGDKIFPAQADIGADFVLSTPSNDAILGQIVAIVDGIYVAGKYQVVTINRGKRHGLVPGARNALVERTCRVLHEVGELTGVKPRDAQADHRAAPWARGLRPGSVCEASPMNGACSVTSMHSANSHAAEEWLVRVLSSSLAIASCRVVGRPKKLNRPGFAGDRLA